jgi:hypothetical protein
LRWRAPGDKYGPDRRRDDAAHREGKMAGRRAGGRFRSGGDAESRKPSQDQQDARRPTGRFPSDQPARSSSAASGCKRPAEARRQSASPPLGQQAPARPCIPPSQGLADQPAETPSDRLATVQNWPKQGQGVRDLVLIGCARGLDAQAESWRLQGHIDSGCQKEAQFVPKRAACPRSRADSA